jgi:hypothetical protein
MSEAMEQNQKEFIKITQTDKKANETDTSLNINNYHIEENKLEIQDSFKDAKISGSDSISPKIQEDDNNENSNRYGLTIPLLFIKGEPFFSISPNCKILIK